MGVDVVTEMTRLWSELAERIEALDAESAEAKIERALDLVVILRGVEAQTLYPGLEEVDDDADTATAAGNRRAEKIQATMEKLNLPPTAKAWKDFASALLDHVRSSETDVGKRLKAMSPQDRADLGERVKRAIDTLS